MTMVTKCVYKFLSCTSLVLTVHRHCGVQDHNGAWNHHSFTAESALLSMSPMADACVHNGEDPDRLIVA